MKKVFFIGMNRTATKSFHNLFVQSGYKSYHYSCPNPDGGSSIILAETMDWNKRYFPILKRFDDSHVYSDMFFHRENRWIDGVKFYRELHKEYPDAYFILNTRNTYDWLLSKKKHKKGDYLKRCCAYWNKTSDEMMDWFEEDREEHHRDVRTYFKNNERFLEYDIDKDDITKLVEFVKPDFFLKEKDWAHIGKTI